MTTETNTYIGVKIVEARPMTRGEYIHYRGWTLPDDEDPADGGYLVIYPDGYESWCPKKQFEEANRPTDGMPFGHAVEVAKRGHKIARRGWNDANMFVVYMSRVPCQPYFALCNASSQKLWLASQSDMLADDWVVVE